MTRYYGVECKTCEAHIALGRCKSSDGTTIAFYTIPLEPVPCTICGCSSLYGPDDFFEFEAEDDIPLPDP